MKIPITKTNFTENEYDIILQPLKDGWVVQGPFVNQFENLWSEFTGAKYSIAVSNCTTALHLSLVSAGIGPGDEVIVPSFTWVSTANVVEATGARPVLCDINLSTFNIETERIENLITPKTKAIIPVHLFGLSVDLNPIINIANKKDLIFIEDAACGFGAKYYGTHVGNFGYSGCFSFHPRKAMTTGEGGMMTVKDEELASKLKSMRDHGAAISDFQRHSGNKPYALPDFPYLGFNYRMTDIQAAIGVTQLKRADEITSERNNIAEKYDILFDNISWLRRPFRDSNYTHGFQAYVCLFEPEEINLNNVNKVSDMRNKFMDYLQSNDIATRPGTHAIHSLTYYVRKYSFKESDYPNSWMADRCSIAFPIYNGMTEEEFNYISEMILRYKV